MAKQHRVEITKRQQWALILHARTAYQCADQDDQASMVETLEEFGVLDAMESMLYGGADEATMAKLYRDGAVIRSLSERTIDFYLQKLTARMMSPIVAVALVPLTKRLKDVKIGAYRAPDETPESAQA